MSTEEKLEKHYIETTPERRDLIDLLKEIRNEPDYIIGIIILLKNNNEVEEIISLIKDKNVKTPYKILEHAFLLNYKRDKVL